MGFGGMSMVQLGVLLVIVIFLFVEWFGRDEDYAIKLLFKNKKRMQQLFYTLIVIIIYFMYPIKESEFIYFQF